MRRNETHDYPDALDTRPEGVGAGTGIQARGFLSIEALSHRYESAPHPTLQSVNLQVQKGELVTLMGPNGSGKSTLLRCIAGFEYPTEGKIFLGDIEISNSEKCLLPEKRNIGIVFQNYALFPHLTVEKNIRFGITRWLRAQARERLEELLEFADLQQVRNRLPAQISGGQQQRVALMRAIAPRPSLLLMDEPFNRLDRDLKDRILEEVKQTLNREKITCICVTHDALEAKQLGSRHYWLEKGQLGEKA